MTNFKYLQSMSADELAKWLDGHLMFDDAPHMQWFVENYCDKCGSIEGQYEGVLGTHKCEFAYCETEHKCRYFQDIQRVPDNLEIIKMWLEVEVAE